tara:strand:- start:631 stop:1083 length:453 start_codon:yes stop_codon:yes gene_type:complete
MSTILEQAALLFSNDGWPIQMASGDVLQTAYKGDSGQWMCHTYCWNEEGMIAFYSICPVSIPEGQRGHLAEFVTRANYNLVLGNFEMDFGSGEIRYKTSLGLENASLTEDLWRPLVLSNIAIMDRYLPGILAVVGGGKSPAQAIAHLESN